MKTDEMYRQVGNLIKNFNNPPLHLCDETAKLKLSILIIPWGDPCTVSARQQYCQHLKDLPIRAL